MPDAGGPVLVAMCGIPFAGKTILAQTVSARYGLALVSVDEIVSELAIDLGRYAENHRGWARAMAEGFERTRRYLAQGKSVVYDSANHTRRNRDRCRRVARQSGADFRCIWVDVPVELARDRLLTNRADPARVDVPDVSFRHIVDEFEPPADEPNVIRYHPGMEKNELVAGLELIWSMPRHLE